MGGPAVAVGVVWRHQDLSFLRQIVSGGLNCLFQIFGRTESDLFARLNADFFAGCRVAAPTCGAFAYLQDATA